MSTRSTSARPLAPETPGRSRGGLHPLRRPGDRQRPHRDPRHGTSGRWTRAWCGPGRTTRRCSSRPPATGPRATAWSTSAAVKSTTSGPSSRRGARSRSMPMPSASTAPSRWRAPNWMTSPGTDRSRVLFNAGQHILVRGEVLSAGDVFMTAGVARSGGRHRGVRRGARSSRATSPGITADIELNAPGEVRLLAFEDDTNDDLEFAPAFLTQELVTVDVVTGFRRVEDGFVLRPVVHWVPTITTEPVDFDKVKVGSEFGTIELRLVQDGYWNGTLGRFREYFIEGTDEQVANGQADYSRTQLNWPGKENPNNIYVLLDGLRPDPASGTCRAATTPLYRTGLRRARPGDPLLAAVRRAGGAFGAGERRLRAGGGAWASGAYEPAALRADQVAGAPGCRRQARAQGTVIEAFDQFTYSEAVGWMHDLAFQAAESPYREWEDLTDSERSDAILGYLGYEKLFDVMFLSGLQEGAPGAQPVAGRLCGLVPSSSSSTARRLPRWMSCRPAPWRGPACRSTTPPPVSTSGPTGTAWRPTSASARSWEARRAPVFQGISVEYEEDTHFVPGYFVDNVFQATPVGIAAGLGFAVDVVEHDEVKNYFDFWFEGFKPLPLTNVRDARRNPRPGQRQPPLHPRRRPQNGIADNPIPGALPLRPAGRPRQRGQEPRLHRRPTTTTPDTRIPASADYIASATERADTILAELDWEKLYDRQRGPRLHRPELRGHSDPQHLGARGTGRRPGHPALHPRRRDRSLPAGAGHLVGHLRRDDPRGCRAAGGRPEAPAIRGQRRDLRRGGRAGAQHRRSRLHPEVVDVPSAEHSPPTRSMARATNVVDYDKAAARWVVTLVPGTAFEQYSIKDGRSVPADDLPYVQRASTTGAVSLVNPASSATHRRDRVLLPVPLRRGRDPVGGGSELIDVSPVLLDNSVKRPDDPEWDLGPGRRRQHRRIPDLHRQGRRRPPRPHQRRSTAAPSTNSRTARSATRWEPSGAFEGNNWRAGIDKNGHLRLCPVRAGQLQQHPRRRGGRDPHLAEFHASAPPGSTSGNTGNSRGASTTTPTATTPTRGRSTYASIRGGATRPGASCRSTAPPRTTSFATSSPRTSGSAATTSTAAARATGASIGRTARGPYNSLGLQQLPGHRAQQCRGLQRRGPPHDVDQRALERCPREHPDAGRPREGSGVEREPHRRPRRRPTTSTT